MTRSSPASTYDDDFFAWTQEQAAALRDAPDHALPRVDIAHLAEEIEDLGKRDLREVCSYLARLIEHLIKVDAWSASIDRAHWSSEAVHFQASARRAFTPGMRQLIDVQSIWHDGRKAADRFLKEVGRSRSMPPECPWSLDVLLAPDFDLDAALTKIAAARASDGRP